MSNTSKPNGLLNTSSTHPDLHTDTRAIKNFYIGRLVERLTYLLLSDCEISNIVFNFVHYTMKEARPFILDAMVKGQVKTGEDCVYLKSFADYRPLVIYLDFETTVDGILFKNFALGHLNSVHPSNSAGGRLLQKDKVAMIGLSDLPGIHINPKE